jgi:outer membrane protein TolC
MPTPPRPWLSPAALALAALLCAPAHGQRLRLPPPNFPPPPTSEIPPPALPSAAGSPASSIPAPERIPREAAAALPEALPGLPPADQALAVQLQPAPLDPTDRPLPINLATALKLADARPLVISAAEAGVQVAAARLDRARVLWIPTLTAGAAYYRHDGGNQVIRTAELTTQSGNFFYGGGGAKLIVATTDAIYEPLAQRRTLEAREADVQAAKNDAMLATALAYFHVHQQRGSYAGALDSVARGRDLVRRIETLSDDLVPEVEVNRARNVLEQLEQQAVSAREGWAIASADLTRVLRLDPAAVVVPLEPDHLAVTVLDPGQDLDHLIALGLAYRPELASHQAELQAAVTRVRQEKMRPALPSVLITGFQTPEFYLNGGVFGTGPNSSLDEWSGRFDMAYQLIWQLEGFGLGNRARIRERQGEKARANIEFLATQDDIAAEVVASQARLRSAWVRMGQAEKAMRDALITYDGNIRGLGETTRFNDVLTLVYRPQEVVVALEHLKSSYDAYFATVAEYNRAQFQLYRDLGYPSQGLAFERPVGQEMSVSTERPGYLPPVVPAGPVPPPRHR